MAQQIMKDWVKRNIPGAEINSQSESANDVFIITTVTATVDRHTAGVYLSLTSEKDTDAGRMFSYNVTNTPGGYDIATINFAKLRETPVNGFVTISRLNSTGTAVPRQPSWSRACQACCRVIHQSDPRR